MSKSWISVDGNTAAALIAHKLNEVIAIYPITPSSPMGELSDEYSSKGKKNLWGTIPEVVEMQSEAGAAGAVHGALTTGALTTTFTSSQGLLLMIPNMFKIAGELTPTVFHIAARAVAGQALNIFGDHSDVMAARMTGFAMLASASVQEVMDFAVIAQAATLESRVPFMHYFDGFRTSHEIQKIEEVGDDVLKAMIDNDLVRAHRERGLNPEKPVIRGTSQNPDVFFAGKETANAYYDRTPTIVQKAMDKFAKLTGRAYKLFEYYGSPDADRVMVIMGSAAETALDTVDYLMKKGEKIGLLKVRLFRPWKAQDFIDALPETVKKIAVLDRTKEPGCLGEPVYEDVRTSLAEFLEEDKTKFKNAIRVVGGRYGLGSKEFDPAMIVSIYDNLKQERPKNHFTVGIYDDLTHTSLAWNEALDIEADDVQRAIFYGLGSDGTVGANKNTIKIIGDSTENYTQGYFVYDSKKAGSVTASHLRFGKKPIRATYLVKNAQFIACHNFTFLKKMDVVHNLMKGGTVLLNSPYSADQVWEKIPVEVQKHLIEKQAKLYVMQASKLAIETGMGNRTNIFLQVAYFMISKVIDEKLAIQNINDAIVKTYKKKGQDVVDKNLRSVEVAMRHIEEVKFGAVAGSEKMEFMIREDAPDFFKKVTGELIAGRGDKVPVSALPDDGTYPTATTRYEKRSIAEFIPTWDSDLCIQCGKCSMVCPHAVIRMKYYDKDRLSKAPSTFKHAEARGKENAGQAFTIQVSPDDCTNCRACFNICPAVRKGSPETSGDKALKMAPLAALRENELKNWDFFQTIPYADPAKVNRATTKGSQQIEPLFEFSGACGGCGETPYVKLITQLFGDRAIISNATGCSSIYGGNLPTTPYSVRKDGRGPAWSNSLFEDAAEFGLGMRLTSDKLGNYARELLAGLKGNGAWDQALVENLLTNKQDTVEGVETQRQNIAALKKVAAKVGGDLGKEIASLADYLIKRSVWVFGGDGFAYDIGYGGLDHVMASGRNVKMLVMDTEVYSNTGGQMSKATPLGATAKFAAGGKSIGKKDLGAMAMSYGTVYVARLSMGWNQDQIAKVLLEADAYDGPALVLVYAHCIQQGIDMQTGMNQAKAVVTSGVWPVYTYDPRLSVQGKNPLVLYSKEPSTPVDEYLYAENRYKSLKAANPERAAEALERIKVGVKVQYEHLKALADRPGNGN